MNTAAIFAAAHYLTRETRQAGDDYQATFASALKIAYANIDRAWDKATKREQLSIKLNGEADAKRAEFYLATCIEDVMDEIIAAAKEAREAAKRAQAAHQAVSRAKHSGGRYIAPLSVAKRDGLNHGRAWHCKELDIETKGAMPEWEGDLICYVYE